MTRFTDAEHTLTLTDTDDNIIDLNNCSDIYITYKQDGVTELTKSGDDITVTQDGSVQVTLKQEETGRFEQGKLSIQIRYKDEDGLARASEWITTACGDVLKKGVI